MKAILLLALLAFPTPGSAAGVTVKTIHLKDGLYTKPFDIVGDRNTRVEIVGNDKHPEKVVIDVKDSDAVRVRKAFVRISGVELRTTKAFSQLYAADGGEIEFSNVRFGLGGKQIATDPGGRIRAVGNYDVAVGGLLHMLAGGGVIELKSNIVVTLHNTVFLAYFAGATMGGLINIEPGVTFAGIASATKFHVRNQGQINSGGLGVAGLPGGSPGVIEGSGQYDALRSEEQKTP